MSELNVPEATDAEVARAEEGFQRLQAADECHSLLKKYLTRATLDTLKHRKTKLGATLYDCISTEVVNLDASIGVYAPDAESYSTFKELFDPIIEEYHGFGPNAKQPPVDLGEGKTGNFPDLDPDGNYILSTRIRCGRSLKA